MWNSSIVGVRRSVAWFVGTLLILFFGGPFHRPLLQPFPAEFRTQTISTNGAKIYVRVGGKGPAVVLLHGYGETGDMWAPLAAEAGPRSHRHRSGPSRNWPLLAAARRIRQEDASRRYCRRA